MALYSLFAQKTFRKRDLISWWRWEPPSKHDLTTVHSVLSDGIVKDGAIISCNVLFHIWPVHITFQSIIFTFHHALKESERHPFLDPRMTAALLSIILFSTIPTQGSPQVSALNNDPG